MPPGPGMPPGGPPKGPPPRNTTLWVGRIAPTVEGPFISQLLEACGAVKEWKPVTEPDSGRLKGFGFVTYEEPEGVVVALQVGLGGGQCLGAWARCRGRRGKLLLGDEYAGSAGRLRSCPAHACCSASTPGPPCLPLPTCLQVLNNLKVDGQELMLKCNKVRVLLLQGPHAVVLGRQGRRWAGCGWWHADAGADADWPGRSAG